MECQFDKFSLDPSSHYLNCAYMSPMLKSVEEAGIQGIKGKRNPYIITPDNFFKDTNDLRVELGNLINTTEPNRIVIIPSVSYGIATVSNNIKLNKGENIVIAGEQFPSNYYAWENICNKSGVDLKVVEKPVSPEGAKEWNEQLIEAINPMTKAVAISHCHWADGTVFDLKAIRRRCDYCNSLLIIDGTQSIGALPFDVQNFRPDALICAGYKWLMGPYSVGFAYYGPAFDNGTPIEENWINRKNSENFAGLVNYQTDYQPGALRYEVGEHSNFILIPMFLEAVKQINHWGKDLFSYISELSKPCIDELQNIGFLLNPQQFRSPHLFGLRNTSLDVSELKMQLEKDKIFVSVRGNSIRVSVNVYNREEDLQALIKACKKSLEK